MWLGRYSTPIPLRCRGRFHVYAAEQAGERVVVVVPGDPLTADSQAFARSLEHLGAAHGAVNAPSIAPLRDVGRFGEQPFAAFTCDAVLDGEQLIARLGETGTRVTYAEAMTAVERLASALAAAHGAIDPDTQTPCVLGALAWANVLVRRDGELQLLGLGHNVLAFDEHGGPAGAPSVFMAPEVAAGIQATPSSDVYAFVAMQRALLAYTEAPPALREALSAPDDGSGLASILRWANERVLGAPPNRRATIDELCRQIAHEIEILGLPDSAHALRARLAGMIATDDAPRPDDALARRDALTIASDGSWLVAPNGERYTVTGRAERRILLALARRRRAEPGACLDSDLLVDIGWPGEQPIREAGLNRLYVAISHLRKRGLRDVLEREPEGYRFAPGVELIIATAGSDPSAA